MNNPDSTKPTSSSVQLDGFAPATGSGAGSSSVATIASSAAAPAPSAAGGGGVGGGGGAGAGLSSNSAATTTTTTAVAAAAAAVAATTTTSVVATTQTKRAKKRGAQQGVGGGGGGGGGATSTSTTAARASTSVEDYDLSEETVLRPLSDIGLNFEPITLPQIQLRLKNLLEQLPKDLPEVPPNELTTSDTNKNNATSSSDGDLYTTIKSFASTLQITIEEYNLLISLVSSATYKWGVDRSGASQQNLAVMSAELQQCQDVISNVVSARLSNVLCPAVDVLIGEVEVVRGGVGGGETNASSSIGDGQAMEMDASVSATAPAAKRIKLNDDRLQSNNSNNNNARQNERRINHYTRPLVDPSYVHLCHCILARNAPLIRHAVATSIHTAHRVIGDYMKAMKKDTSHDAGKGGYY